MQSSWMESLREQWQSSHWVRIGFGVVVVLIWSEGLLRLGDLAALERKAATESVLKSQSEALAGDPQLWVERTLQAEAALKAWQPRLWPGQDRGLVEAQAQDALRALASKTGLNVRDIRVVQEVESTPKAAYSAVRLRATFDHTRAGTLALLSQLSEERPLLVVDRVALRLAAQPPQLELDLRAVIAVKGSGA